MAHNLCALRVECGGRYHRQRPPTSFRQILVQVMCRNCRAHTAWSTLAIVRGDISHRDQTQGCRRENVGRARLILLLIPSEHWPFATNIEPGYLNLSTSPNIKQDSLARHHLGLRSVNGHTDCGAVVINSFKQALHLAIATAEYHDVVGIGEVVYMDVVSNMDPWVIL